MMIFGLLLFLLCITAPSVMVTLVLVGTLSWLWLFSLILIPVIWQIGIAFFGLGVMGGK